jgi:hypothetical protein
VKNLTGVDSVESARRDMVRRWAGWLESCGVTIPWNSEGQPDCTLEIDARVALDGVELRGRLGGGVRVAAGGRLYLN